MLRAGAAMSNITPMLGVSMPGGFTDRIATNVHDELHSKAIVLDNGDTRIALVVCDVIVLESEYVNRARKLIQDRCNIPQQNIMISATHTHTGPATASACACRPGTRTAATPARRTSSSTSSDGPGLITPAVDTCAGAGARAPGAGARTTLITCPAPRAASRCRSR